MLFFVAEIWASPKPPHFSDLYPSWYGARELFLHHRDSYGSAVTHDVQFWTYGHVISEGPQRLDQNRFVYPLYIAFLLSPLVGLRFEQVQEFMRLFLPALSLGTVLLWIKAMRWRSDWATLAIIGLLSLTNFPMLESIYLQQPALLAAAFLAGACAALVSGRMVLSGMLLAWATIKPQLCLFIVPWIIFWGCSDWIRRRNVVLSFAATWSILVCASELLLHGWIYEFVQALIAYEQYNGTSSILTLFFGEVGSMVVITILITSVGFASWRARCERASSERFYFILCLLLVSTLVMMPTIYPTAQIVLLPAIFLIVKDSQQIWSGGRWTRLVYVGVLGLMIWPWVGALLFFILQIGISIERLRAAWIVVLAPVPLLPPSLLVLLLVRAKRVLCREVPCTPHELGVLGQRL